MSLRRIAIFVAFLISTTKAIQLLSEDPVFYDAPEILLENSRASYRLPDDVVPSNYEIELTVKALDGKDFSFTGKSTIDINVIKKVSAIVLHAQNLTIDSKITLLSSTEPNKILQDAEDHSIDTTTNFLTIKFKSAIEIGKYKLNISYTGVINDQLRGFHQGYYTDQSGVKKWIASTHFEPVGARLAFPCWDEPALKATFTIIINHDEDYTALSNMRYKLQEPTTVDNQVKTTFEQTPKMSTYLVAFAVVDFDSLSNQDDKSLKVWAKKNSVELRKYAVDVGLKALKALEAYTKINYKDHGFKKMDFIALPQFAAGAMENWGLVTYREKRLLYDEKESSLYDKEGVAKVIAHELAHQWFGNYVSPKWWQYVWLNEGFAAYFEYAITNQVETKWRLMERFVVETIQNTAFVADSLNTSHVMDVSVESPKDISSIFDSITYSKAASVIRMISHIVGEDKFKTALNTYLTANKFNVATSEVLFAEINKVTDTNNQTPLKTALPKWATTPGYPVVNIMRDYKNKKANITQFRFLMNQNETDPKKYWIPLNFASQADLNFNLSAVFTWFDGDKSNVIVDAPAENHWLICNLQQFGYYRVNYDEQNWKLITQYLLSNHSGIHLLNRAQLINDALNLARANYSKYKIAFDLIKYLKQETDFVPWSSAWNGLSYLNRLLTNTQLSSDFREFVTSLTESSIKSVSFEESSKDEHITKLHRMKLIENTCRMGLKSCIDYASQKFSLWLSDSEKNPLSKDTKSLIICNGVRNADNTTWNKLLSKYEENNDDDILTGLGCTSNKGLLNSYLKMAINDSFLGGSRDKVFKAVYEGSDFGVDVTLDFLNNNIHDLLVSNTASAQNVKTYISDIGSRVTKKEQIAKIELIKKQDTSLKVGIIDDGLEKAQANVDWLELRYAEIQEYFKKPDPTPSTNQPGSGTAFTASLILLISSIVFTVFY